MIFYISTLIKSSGEKEAQVPNKFLTLQVTWTRPYAWPGFEALSGLQPVPEVPGLYLQTFEYGDGYVTSQIEACNSHPVGIQRNRLLSRATVLRLYMVFRAVLKYSAVGFAEQGAAADELGCLIFFVRSFDPYSSFVKR